jgi:hypothetical protein
MRVWLKSGTPGLPRVPMYKPTPAFIRGCPERATEQLRLRCQPTRFTLEAGRVARWRIAHQPPQLA